MATAINQYGIKTPTDKKKKKKVAYITKKKKYTGKKYDTSALAAGQQVLTARKGRKDRGKKYGIIEAGEIKRNAREDARKNITTPRPFGDAFKAARAAKKDKFLWKGKSYHTKTKSELEKATGASEKERFERAGKAKETTKKRNIFQKIARKMRGTNPDGSTRTQAEYEAAKAKRKSKAK